MVRKQFRTGVTLIEIMISLVLVSTVLLVSLTASANLLRQNVEARVAVDAETLGGQILDEITAFDFEDRESPVFGPEPDESASDRSTFDDVDDYDGYTSKPASHRDGSDISGFESWGFAVSVKPVNFDSSGVVSSNDKNAPLRMITVTTTAPDGTTSEFTGLVTSVRSNIDEGTSYERWRRLTVRFNSRNVTVAVPMRNQPDAY